jgi:class 3 adenylate cyclase
MRVERSVRSMGRTTSQVKRTGLPCTVLFVDVCGSTKLYSTLGNERGQAAIEKTLDFLSQVATRYLGTIIKKTGDGLLCTFATAREAADASADMHRCVRKGLTLPSLVRSLAIRVGFHSGPVLSRGADIYGDAVNVAARMVAQAKAGQIIVAKETVKALPKGMSVRHVASTEVKGKHGLFDLFEIIWDHQNLTVMRAPMSERRRDSKLTVRFGEATAEVGSTRPVIHLGRGPDNEIVVPHPIASRVHARIEYRRGRFVLVDQSLNGTYLMVKGGTEVALRRDEIVLEGSGIIGLGRSAANQGDQCVRFAIRSPGGS